MTTRIGQVVFAAMTIGLSFPAFAALDEALDKQLTERFTAADKNADKKLTLDEAQAGMPRIAAGFSTIDSGKRGYLSLEQIKAFVEARQ